MLRPYDLLENVLLHIEKDIKKSVNSDILAEKYSVGAFNVQSDLEVRSN